MSVKSMHTALMEMAQNQMDEVKSVDYGKRMTDAQKKKFHDLKKKMTDGPEHQKIMRKNQSPVKSDDEFHNLVLKKAMSEERAAWVPESIADEQVEAFMEATIAAIAEGEDTFVFEGKSYKAKSKSEAKKLDPVGKADADIDNDGDVDSSDEYLKKRRKAIKKSMAEEMDPTDHVKKKDDKYCVYDKDGEVAAEFDNEEEANAYARKNHDALMGKEEMDESVSVKKQDYKWGRMMTVHHGKSHSFPLHPEHQSAIKKLGDNQKTSFKDETGAKVTADRQGDTVHLSKFGTNKKTPVAHSQFTESVNEASAPGATAQHGPDKATTDTYQKQMNTGSADVPMGDKQAFVDQHKMEVGLDAEQEYMKNKAEAENVLKQTPPRMGDQRNGDTSFVNPIKAEVIDGITKALQQMKTNN